jgi:hypothetical protein
MTTLGDYEPAIETHSLLLKWIRRARESQMSQYAMANPFGRRNHGRGVSVIAMTSLIGTTAFLSTIATSVSPLVRIVIGLSGQRAGIGNGVAPNLPALRRARRAASRRRRTIRRHQTQARGHLRTDAGHARGTGLC